MKEVESIRKKLGKENAFRVPDGYFEGLTQEIMQQLPEKDLLSDYAAQPTMWQRVRPWLYMAAMFVGAALIIRVASVPNRTAGVELAASDDAESEYISMAIDNSMFDDYSLYVYMDEVVAE